jgi:hypothetical protein
MQVDVIAFVNLKTEDDGRSRVTLVTETLGPHPFAHVVRRSFGVMSLMREKTSGGLFSTLGKWVWRHSRTRGRSPRDRDAIEEAGSQVWARLCVPERSA